MNEEKVQKVKRVLLKYLLPDCLRPEHDGMTAETLSRIIIGVYESDSDSDNRGGSRGAFGQTE